MIGPCVDSFSCGFVPAWPAGHWRWDALMGPRMGDPLDDPPDSPEGEAGPQRTVWIQVQVVRSESDSDWHFKHTVLEVIQLSARLC